MAPAWPPSWARETADKYQLDKAQAQRDVDAFAKLERIAALALTWALTIQARR